MNLVVTTREKVGRSAVAAVRREGLIPGEVYGHGFANIHIAVPAKEFAKALKEAGETTVINLQLGDEAIPTLIYEVTHDPFLNRIRHVDFYRVRMDEKISAKVPIEYIGQSPAVKAGGVLVKAVHDIEVEALPQDIPRHFEADLARIVEIGGSLYVKDIMDVETKYGGIITVALGTVIATVIAPRAEEEQATLATPLEDVKVETDEKKAERQKEKAAGAEEKKE